jgi:hypothetical protein
VVLALALPAWAAPRAATLSGTVRSAGGVAQMGALVEVLSAAGAPVRTLFSDGTGKFTVQLPAGTYNVRVSANSFLPSLRENVLLVPGGRQIIAITLNTLFEAVQMVPQRRRSTGDDDEWRWTLRSVGNRPILRVLDDGQSVVVSRSENPEDRRLKAHVAFVAGAEAAGFGSSAQASTVFSLERSMFSTGMLAFQGDVGYSEGEPGGVIRATYAQDIGGSRPEVAITARRFATLSTVPQYGALEAFSVRASDTVTVADFLEVTGGSEFQSVQFARQMNAFRPFGRVDVHMGPDMVLEYRYASSQPSTRAAKGFDTAPADLSESGPRMSLDGDQAMLEHARHHELALSRRFGRLNVQAAAYLDQISDAALLGVGTVGPNDGQFLPDVYSNTFTWNGGNLSTTGARVVVQEQFSKDLNATLDYATGGVIAIADRHLNWDDAASALRNERRHAVALKLQGKLPRTHTQLLTSYRWTNRQALTPVDWFDEGPGQADPYFSVFVRQPLPATDLFPGKMELVVDVRNLLAQGYIPVMGRDGQTLYLVQAARSVRGGVAFSF